MNSFVETISPAAKEHIQARVAYFNDVALAMLESGRQLADANLRFGRDWLTTSTDTWRTAVFTPAAERQADVVPTVESVTQKFQAYHQQVVQISSNFQTTINDIAKQHVPQTARTATALAEVVSQKAAVETDQQIRLQQTAGKEILDKATQFAQTATRNRAMQEPASMQRADDGEPQR